MTDTKGAVLLAICVPLAVVGDLVLVDVGLIVAYPAWLLDYVVVWLPVVSLLLALGSLFLATTSLRDGIRGGRLAILGAALIEVLWTALFVSSNVNDWVCNHPCLVPLRPPGL